MPRRWFWSLFICITFTAFLLRIWQLGHLPVSLYWDEAAMFVDVKSVLATGTDMHGRPWYQLIYPSYGDYKLPVYIWLATASSALFGLSEFSLRLPSAVTGVLTVVLAGLIARELLSKTVRTQYSERALDTLQLFTMGVLTLTPWSLLFSRTAFEGHVGQMFLATSLYFVIKGLGGKKSWLFWLGPIFGALATYSYFSVRFVWVVIYIGLASLFLWQRYGAGKRLSQWRSVLNAARFSLLKIILGLLLFGLLLIPLLRSPLAKDADTFRLGTASVLNNPELVHQSNESRLLAGNTRIDRLFYNRPVLLIKELAKNYSDNMSPAFLFISGDPNLRHGTGQTGLFLLVLAPAFLLGGAVLFKRHTLLGAFLGLWWVVALLPASVPENTPHALRSLNALVPLTIVIGFGLTWMWYKAPFIVARAVIIIAVLFSFAQFWWFYSTVYPSLSADDWQSGYAVLAKHITNETDKGKEVYVVPFDDRFYLWYMGYGPFTGSEFQAWKSDNYKFAGATLPSMKGVEFIAPDNARLSQLVSEGRAVVLVGEIEDVQERCQTGSFQCEILDIADEAKRPKFQAATLMMK